MHPDRALGQTLLKSAFHEPEKHAAGGGQKEGKTSQVRDHPWGKEERSSHQESRSGHERPGRYLAARQLPLEIGHGSKSLPAHEMGAQEAGAHNKTEGGPEPYPAPHLNQQDKFQNGNENEKRKEPSHSGGVSSVEGCR